MIRQKRFLILPILLFLGNQNVHASNHVPNKHKLNDHSISRQHDSIRPHIHKVKPHILRAVETEDHCLATAIYWESGNEPFDGQVAVAEVIMNRYHQHIANSICKVISQPGQFGFRRANLPKIRPDLYEKCHDIAMTVLSLPKDEYIIPEKVLYFNTKGSPKFMQNKLRLYRSIGHQNFYYKQ
jgi:spore germination cell wall hydrolase CwlJ-like protein